MSSLPLLIKQAPTPSHQALAEAQNASSKAVLTLDRSNTTCWNIAMVDEVAWGVGWGSENNDITPADSDEEFQVPTRPRSHSWHHLEESIPEDPEWQQEEPSLRPALDAAS
ncbi:hypothetical protein DXG01_004695 [Tephrocybe rancida]|nr:hypothetical protein DXG01_004695 [Tephrocybe rancida]